MGARCVFAWLCSCLILAGSTASATDQIVLRYEQTGAQGTLALKSKLGLPISGMYPEYTILCSTNLQTWFPLTNSLKGGVGVSDELLRAAVPQFGKQAVFKVRADLRMSGPGPTGDSIYGYATQFGMELQGLGQLPIQGFEARYGLTNSFLPGLSHDSTTAEYWDLLAASALRLNAQELAVFQTNGFVVSERLGTYSFTDQFYQIYTRDLPVFFSADAALHAWHRSFSAMLEELEETYLGPRLQLILGSLSGQVARLASDATGTALANGVLDADLFVAVGLSLASGTNNYGMLGQNTQVASVLNAVAALQPAEINLFGTNRIIDFSQFRPRGHYTTSQRLQRYFKAMMWCGIVDFRFTGSTGDNSLRELSDAVAMRLLLDRAGQFNNWAEFDRIIQVFVGTPDSLNFAQLGDLLAASGINSPSSLPDQVALQALQDRIMSGQLGVQDIRSGYFLCPLGPEQVKLPRSFTFLGQRFTLDAWALSKCTFDSIIWDEDGVPGFEDKVLRRVPSALDVAFSVLANDHTVPDIVARIQDRSGHHWRDGYPYQHNLGAVRNVVDAQDVAAWTNTLYGHWLGCLRELSRPTTGPEYPEAMRTRSWAMKTLNAQLASWTELKHDTVLYAKQPYTAGILCLYPAGYVEPRTNFWARMRQMALGTSNLLTVLPQTGNFVFEPNDGGLSWTVTMQSIYTNRLQFLGKFAQTMAMLEGLSQRELTLQPFSEQETNFIQNLVELTSTYSGIRTYSGWYPNLFYNNARSRASVISPSDQRDQLVTDVHTDVPAPLVGDPGSILHEAVGNVLLLTIAIDSGPDSRAVYTGPVFSHYEFELGPTTRQTDSEWQTQIDNGILPPQPDWTRSYLVPAR